MMKGPDALRVLGCLVFLGCWVLESKDFTLSPATQAPQILPPSEDSQLEGKTKGARPQASLLPAKAASSHVAVRSPSEKRDLLLAERQPGPGFGEAERAGWTVRLTCCRAGRPGGASSITFPDSSAWMPAMPS